MDDLMYLLEGSGLEDAIGLVTEAIAIAQGMMAILVVIGVLAFLLPWFYFGFMYSCAGKKAGVSADKGWMCFLPIAREIYLTGIIRYPIWYILFLDGVVNSIIAAVLFLIFGVGLHLFVIGAIVVVAFMIASMVFQFTFYKEFYKRFGFDKNLAFASVLDFAPINTVGGPLAIFTIIQLVVLTLIAFDKRIQYSVNGKVSKAAAAAEDDSVSVSRSMVSDDNGTRPVKPAFITGVSGKYAGATFEVGDGKPVIFGRSADEANIVFDQFDTDISRKHCSVRFDSLSGQYLLVDYSTNGTYDANNTRFPQKQQVNVAPGTVIYLGKSHKNAFRIG